MTSSRRMCEHNGIKPGLNDNNFQNFLTLNTLQGRVNQPQAILADCPIYDTTPSTRSKVTLQEKLKSQRQIYSSHLSVSRKPRNTAPYHGRTPDLCRRPKTVVNSPMGPTGNFFHCFDTLLWTGENSYDLQDDSHNTVWI